MRISDWAVKFGITVKRCEERADNPPGSIVYRVKDIFTTRDGSWDPSSGYGSIPQWARDAYLRPLTAPDYFDDAGAAQHLFARVLDLEGKPVTGDNLVRLWPDGFDALGNPGYTGYKHATPKRNSGWANWSVFENYSPEAGQHGPWCWCPEGAADVVTGGGLPNNRHVSTFVVWQAERRAGEEPPSPPSDEFVVTPETVAPGQTATLHWRVARARTFTVEGPGLSGEGSSTAAPAQSGRYTLRVVLEDGSTRELTAAVTVRGSDQGGGGPSPHFPTQGTRPPTVALTAQNIAHLRTFPRPPDDNGIGLHFHLDLRDETIAETVEHLKSIRATWTLVYAQDHLQAKRAAAACWQAGIMPVVRIHAKIDGPAVDPAPFVEALKAIGAPPYVQIYNEPEDYREWRHDIPDDWRAILGRNWAHTAARVVDLGGYAGLQVLTREAFDAVVDAVGTLASAEIWKRAFFVQHNYAENHPPAFPYDERNQRDNPGQTILADTLGVLGFLAYAHWMQERIGTVLPIIGGEGGWLYGAEKDLRYPKVEGQLHADYTRQMFEWLRTGVLANGEPLPDYLFSITPWIAGSWTFGGQNWWHNMVRADGKLTETIAAVQAIPPFVRKSSWDG